MAGKIHYLKQRDTLPILDVFLLRPDGTVQDLTGSSAVWLHVKLMDGTVLSRQMTVNGPATNGNVRYAWATSDWNPGGLVPGIHHHMEYEVLPGPLTFPNDGDDILRITPDIGQA